MTFFPSDRLESLVRAFREPFDFFVFFHLGDDADVHFEAGGEGLTVSVAHSRVVPFDFHLSLEQLDDLVGDQAKLEAFLLEQLTRCRT